MKDDCAECDKESSGKSIRCQFDRIYSKMDFCGWLDDAPTIAPDTNVGKWIFKNDLKQFFCDKCDELSLTYDDVYIYGMDLPKFCPNCGAKNEVIEWTPYKEDE